MAGVSRTVDITQFAAEMRDLGASPPSLAPLLKTCRLLIISDAKKNFDEGHSPDGATWKPLAHRRIRGAGVPLRDRGILMASVTGKGVAGHVEVITEDSLTVGSNLAHAPVHQYGAKIVPRRGKYLAIPLTIEAFRAGSARNFPGLVGIYGPRGGVLKDAKDKVHYALTRSVTIPARPFLGWSARLILGVANVFADALVAALGGTTRR